MADISFLLLIFFLVTTTMSVDKGLSRQLPPPLPPDAEKPQVEIKQRNIFVVLVNSNDELLVQGEPMDIRNLKEKAKEFILNASNSEHLPEVVATQVDFGNGEETVMTTKNHIISLQNDRGTHYQKYIEVQNELVAAYNELREEYSREKFNLSYEELSEDQQKGVQAVFPQKISEAEPKNYGGNK